jgi:cysteine synthase
MNLMAAIENTPLMKLSHLFPQSYMEAWIKYEGANPTFSYKDRKVPSMIKVATQQCDSQIRAVK